MRLCLIVLALLVATQAWAKSYCISADGFKAGDSVNSATQVNSAASSTTASYTTWRFPNTGGNYFDAVVPMFFPPDATAVTLTPQIKWHSSSVLQIQHVCWQVGFRVLVTDQLESELYEMSAAFAKLTSGIGTPSIVAGASVETTLTAIEATTSDGSDTNCPDVATCAGTYGRLMAVRIFRDTTMTADPAACLGSTNLSAEADIEAFCFSYQ